MIDPLNPPGSKLLAKFFATRLGFFLLRARARRTPPVKHLGSANGDLYMGRWRLVDEHASYWAAPWWKRSATLHAAREWSARLHHIVRPDHDRDLHNHPFSYRTYVVKGWYEELYLDPQGIKRHRRISAGETSYSGGAWHRITRVSPGGVWTVFVMDKNHGEWGFRVIVPQGNDARVTHKYVPSRDYFKARRDSGDTFNVTASGLVEASLD